MASSARFCDLLMGETAEALVDQYKISREEQDQFALRSQQRAENAIKTGRFNDEIAPVTLETKKGVEVMDQDEHPFFGSSMEKLVRLAPVFSDTGTVTAGNSSGITDGAAPWCWRAKTLSPKTISSLWLAFWRRPPPGWIRGPWALARFPPWAKWSSNTDSSWKILT